jgi:peptidoglycan/xylan/chitin deacetylase (PgdA/CDA1 family)
MGTRGVALGTVLGAALAACTDRSLVSQDDIYSHGADHFVLCAASIDDIYGVTVAEVGDALDRAQADDATLHLYTHTPGLTVAMATLEGTLAAVSGRGMRFATYDDLSAGEVPGSLALSFDDHAIATWTAMRPLLDRHHARVTFFVSTFLTLSEDEHAQLQQLAADGHDIEYHSTSHLDAEAYSNANGIDAYLADDIVPALDAMRAAGYATTIFAYPFGTRTAATDAALSQYFVHLRAIRSRCPQ